MRTLKSLSNLELIALAKQDRDSIEIREEDFDPPMDHRVLRSGVANLYGGDNFGDYTEEFFEMYESNLFD